MGHARINLNNVTSLLADRDSYTRGLVAQMLRGFGMDSPILADSGAEAKEILAHHTPDLCIIEAILPDITSAELISWIRRTRGRIRFVPTIVLTGYTQLRMVSAARDAGANIVVKKPVAPKTLFDHILWIARAQRPFIETSDYVGPERRFRSVPPSDGVYKRETDNESEHECEKTSSPSEGYAPKWLANR